MTGAALLILGFSTAADVGFDAPRAYAVIIVAFIVLAVAVYHFLTTKRNAIVPAVSSLQLRTRIDAD